MDKKAKFFIAHINDETFLLIDDDKDVINFSFKGSLSDRLHISFKQFLDLYGINLKDIDSVYVCRGPGSFTSLRTIILFAKTLCLCLGVKLFSANIFEIFLCGIGDNKKGIKNIALFSKKNAYYLANISKDKDSSDYKLFEESELNEMSGLLIGDKKLKNFKNISLKDIKIKFDIFREENIYSFEPEYGVELNVKTYY
jgi:tRNA threonylcarbamoyladenosine biosynthesis protein TsaB